MIHQTFMEAGTAERYVIGDLPTREREAFEAHYFECEECAEEVRLGARFAAGLNAEFERRSISQQKASVVTMPARRWAQLAVAASLALCAFTGWQNLIRIPAMRAELDALETPRALRSVVLAPSGRAAVRSIKVSGEVVIPMTLAGGAAHGDGPFECRLESDSGVLLRRFPVPAFDEEGNVQLQLPVFRLAAGGYQLVLMDRSSAGNRTLDRYRFALVR